MGSQTEGFGSDIGEMATLGMNLGLTSLGTIGKLHAVVRWRWRLTPNLGGTRGLVPAGARYIPLARGSSGGSEVDPI